MEERGALPGAQDEGGEDLLEIPILTGSNCSPDWDVFDRDGRYLGVVTLPDRWGSVDPPKSGAPDSAPWYALTQTVRWGWMRRAHRGARK